MINGKGQRAGSEYHTDYFNINENNSTVSVGLKNVYENKDEIIEYTRTLAMQDSIIITDRISLLSPGCATFNFYTPCTPSIISGSSVTLGNGVIMNYSDNLTVKINKIELTDNNLQHDWKTDNIYQICFSIDTNSTLIDVKFEILKM